MANRTTHCVILRPDGGLAGLVVAGQTLDGEQWQALLGAAQARCLQIDQMDERARGVIGRTEISAAEDGVPAMAAHMLRVGSISASQMECAAFQLADGGATRGNQANVINGLADALETAYQALDDASGVVDASEGEAITYEAELGTVLNALAQARPGHWTAKRDEFQRDLLARRDQGAGREPAAPAAIEVGQRYVYQCAGEDRAQYNGQVVAVTRAITEPDGEHDGEVLPMFSVETDGGATFEAFPDELTSSVA